MTSIALTQDQFKIHRYKAKVLYIPKNAKPEDVIDLSRNLVTLRIVKDFDTQVMPYYRIELGLSTTQVRTIQQGWKEATLNITLSHRYIKDTSVKNSEEYDTLEDYLTDAQFKIMVVDNSPNAQSAEQDGVANSIPMVMYQMELCAIAPLDINKRLNNSAYHGCTTTDIVASLTDKSRPIS